MNGEKFEKIMADWASREEAAAPRLQPPEELRRRVSKRRGKAAVRSFPRAARWAVAAACLIGVAIFIRAFLFPSPPRPEGEHLQLLAQTLEGVAVKGPTLEDQKPAKGSGNNGNNGNNGPAKEPKKGSASFSQFLFQYHRQGSRTVTGIDLLTPYDERVLLDPGDTYRLGLRPAGDHHFYVFQMDAETGLEQLFPNEEYSLAENPLRGGEAHYLPAKPNWFSLAEKQGEERIYAVASNRPLPGELFSRFEKAQGEGEREEIAARLRDRLESLCRESLKGVEVVVFSFNAP